MKIGAVILAAGAGTRLGGVAKALLTGKDGRTYLQRIVETCREVGVDMPIVVVGAPFRAEVGEEAARLDAVPVVNPDPSRGMASSVSIGFDVLAQLSDIEAGWLWPVDHPAVSASTLERLISALMNHDAARPVYQGRGGHPPLIARKLFERITTWQDVEGGARAVLAAADTVDVAVDDPGCVRDVDTPADLEAV